LGSYNEHLVRDYGALNLALGVLLVFAAVSPEGGLVRASLVAWLVYATPHFVFHLTQVHTLAPVDNVALATHLLYRHKAWGWTRP
jgi:hypothetical protein